MFWSICVMVCLANPPADPPEPITIEVVRLPRTKLNPRLMEGRGQVSVKDEVVRILFKAKINRPGFNQIQFNDAEYDPKTKTWQCQLSVPPFEHEYFAELVTRGADGKEKLTESKKIKLTVK